MLDQGGALYPQGSVDFGDARVIAHPPGYSMLMAAATLTFGEPDVPLRLTQIILAALQTVMLVLIAAELLPSALAVIAGLITALSPHLAYCAILLSPDSLAVLPILIAVYLIIRANKHPRLVTIIGAGMFLGLSCWLRSNALFLSLFLSLAILFLFQSDKRLRYALALVAAALVVIAPITLRNWIVYGSFIPLSIGSGLNLMEGIAEYDKQGRFELPVLDPDVMAQEAERFGRPEYGQSLYYPDGVERDRARFSRGLRVVRSNPGWFLGVMLRRMLFMLRYNDYRIENPAYNTTLAPAVSARPQFGNELKIPDGVPSEWSRSMTETIVGGAFAPDADVSVNEQGDTLQIVGDNSVSGDQFISAPIAVQQGTDYVFVLQVRQARGALSARVRTSDPRVILASSRVLQRKIKKKNAGLDDIEANSRNRIYLYFASGNVNEVRVAIVNDRVNASDRTDPERPVVQLGRADLFSLGVTPYQWTRYPRSLIRGIQKNLYKTEWMWLLIAIGTASLAVARRWRALLILGTVPAYYLIVHSALHTEYRYILAIHYFLAICAGAAFYIAWKIVWGGVTSDKPGRSAFLPRGL